VILLDLILPGISGLELLRRYRREGGKAKVLVMTGALTEWCKRMSFAAGANFILGKPLNWEELVESIRLLYGGLEEMCRELLKAMGAKEKGAGFRQAARCAALLGEGECQLLKEAYIEAAARDRSSPVNISKNIERLAEELHGRRTELFCRLFPGWREGPPTNREFLDILSQAARIPL